MQLTYPACFYPFENTPGGYTVEVPDLPGCVSEGRNFDEALFMAADAASGWILDELDDGRPVPPASLVQDIQPGPGGFVVPLTLDIRCASETHGDVVLP